MDSTKQHRTHICEISSIEEEFQEDNPSFTCKICIEPFSSSQRFQNKSCYHNSYCKDCVAYYVETKIQEYNMAEIMCPGLDCKELLDPLECRSILSARVFDRWCDSLCELAVLRMGFRGRSNCPYPDCSTVFVSECILKTFTLCSRCKLSFCFRCKIPWKVGHICTVEDIETDNGDDILVVNLAVEKEWRKCPGCGMVVERISGCPSIRCRCGTTFCYESGVVYGIACSCSTCRKKFLVFILMLIVMVILAILLPIWL